MNKSTIDDKKIGIIGFGKFGKLIGEALFPKNDIYIYTSQKIGKTFPSASTLCDSIPELLAHSDIIIPAVPIRVFEKVITSVAKEIQNKHIIMDVCSVKDYPVKIMRKYLPQNTQIIATHPMFGPTSVLKNKNTLHNLRIVMHNISTSSDNFQACQQHFSKLGLELIDLTPQDHDALAARSHFFSKIIKYIGDSFDLQKTAIDTLAADKIFEALLFTSGDTTIIQDMITYNPYCKSFLKNVIVLLKDIPEAHQ